MSIYAIVWAYEQDIPNAGIKFTLVTAAQYCNDEGICWVKQETLAQDMSMGVSTVRRHLGALENQFKLIKRIERRRKDGTRTSDLIKLVPFDNRPNRAVDQPTTAQIEQINRSNRAGNKRQRETYNDKESSNESSLSADSPNGSPPEPEVFPQDVSQWTVSQLMDRVSKAKEGGWHIHSPTNDERKQFGRMAAQAVKDGYTFDAIETALDFMVHKAADQIENEKPAWCGFRTALDRVTLDNWTSPAASGLSEEEREELRERARARHERFAAEMEKLHAEGKW